MIHKHYYLIYGVNHEDDLIKIKVILFVHPDIRDVETEITPPKLIISVDKHPDNALLQRYISRAGSFIIREKYASGKRK